MKTKIRISTDPIADMLTRVRNAMLVGKNEVEMPYSKLKEQVAKVISDTGFLSDVSASDEDGRKTLRIVIHGAGESPRITEIARVSSPGRRVYVKAGEIPVIRRGRGMVVISTSHGVMSGQEAGAKGLGGELICRVY